MADFIYSRISTDKQDNQNQLVHLQRLYPNAEIREETASGVKHRPILEKLLKQLSSGDTLVIAALDRLGRRTSQAIALIEDLYARNIKVVSIREGLDYSTPAGRMVTQIMMSVAEMERSLIVDRIKASLRAKKAQGIRLGRPSTIPTAIVQQVHTLRNEGKTIKQINKLTSVSTGRICQLLKSA